MTAKRLAEQGMEAALTQALIGEENRSTAIAAGCLAAIARFGNAIPPHVGCAALAGQILKK